MHGFTRFVTAARNAAPALARPVRRLGRLLRRRSTPLQDLLATVDSVRLDLVDLARGSEQDFLDLGDRLLGFHTTTQTLSENASSVAELLMAEGVGDISDGLREIALWTNERENATRRHTERFTDVLALLARMGSELNGFRTVVRTLDVLCVSTRIECARLAEGDMGFHTLAADVRKLAREIESKCDALVDKQTALVVHIGSALTRTREMETTLASRMQGVTEGTRTSLEALGARQEEASEGARRVAERYRGISRSIGEVVSSLQFHDITRQRVEHAAEALGDALRGNGTRNLPMEEDAPDGRRGADGSGSVFRKMLPAPSKNDGGHRKRLEFAGDISELQAAQLDHAREEVIAAIGTVTDNLFAIAEHARGIAVDSGAISGLESDSGGVTLRDLSDGLDALADQLTGYAAVDETLRHSIRSVGETLAEMSSFADGIDAIGNKVQLIALNAIVKACRMGDQGASLGVLAEAIHTLSSETRVRTANMEEILRAIESAAQSLSEETGDEARGEAGMDRITKRLTDMREALPSLNDRVGGLLDHIRSEGETLAEAIDEALSGITVREVFDEVLAQAAGTLREVSTSSMEDDGGPSPEKTAAREARLKTFESLYTMRQERNVHERIAGATALPAPAALAEAEDTIELRGNDANGSASPETGKEADEELGDNVELF